MRLVSEADLLARSLQFGLSRLEATVLAHLAFHEQLKGGVQIAGASWRYRTVAEIGAKVGYESRSVTRAIGALVEADLIERRTIWDPRWAGRRVNSYRLTKAGLLLLVAAEPKKREGPTRTRQSASLETVRSTLPKQPDVPCRSGQNGAFIHRRPDNQPGNELVTLLPMQQESVSKLLHGDFPPAERMQDSFSDYLEPKRRLDLHQEAQVFWRGLEQIFCEITSNSIEPGDSVVYSRCAKFLSLFSKPQHGWLSRIDHCYVAVWAYLNWPFFSALIEQEFGSRPRGDTMNSYHMEKHMFLLLNHLVKCNSQSSLSSNYSDWLNNDF